MILCGIDIKEFDNKHSKDKWNDTHVYPIGGIVNRKSPMSFVTELSDIIHLSLKQQRRIFSQKSTRYASNQMFGRDPKFVSFIIEATKQLD